MPITHTVSREFLKKLMAKEIEIGSAGDAFVVCLMAPDFTFDPATPTYYTDISANEIAAGNGYTQKEKALANMAVADDNGNVLVNADSVTWTADGGSIADTGGACIVWDAPEADGDKLVCGYIHFGGATYGTGDGNNFQINFANGVFKGNLNP